jgi:spoIIIJ-associated protein
MEESILFAKKYLEDLLSFFGLNIDVYATKEDDIIMLSVPSTHMNGFLIGQRGDTMRSLQYMVSTALKNNNYEFSRVNVDIADYKKGRQSRLAQQALPWLDKVRTSGQEMSLQPMNAADRRVIHKLADEQGLSTISVGVGRDRYVIIRPVGEDQVVEDEEESTKPAKKAVKPKKTKSDEEE